jgi:hypothetical protein
MPTTYYQSSTGMTAEQAMRILPAGIAAHILGQKAAGVDELEIQIRGNLPEEEMQVICLALCVLLEGWAAPTCVVSPELISFHAHKDWATHQRFIKKLHAAEVAKGRAARRGRQA